jgi:[protein-PII] uridylyltransferase
MGLSIRAARVTTLGSEAVDAFYVVDGDGRPLDAGAVREASRLLVDAGG